VICAVLYLQPKCHPYTVYKLNSFFYINICSFIAVGSNLDKLIIAMLENVDMFLRGPSYSQFCPKIRCHGNGGWQGKI